MIKEIRDSFDYLVRLPKLLVQQFFDIKDECYERRDRIRKQKEIVELREVGKSLLKIYSAKGDLSEKVRGERISDEDVEMIRENLSFILIGLEDIESSLLETTFNDIQPIVTALNHLKKCRAVYSHLLTVPRDEFLLNSVQMKICLQVEELSDAGKAFIEELDSHRKLLDYTY
jgi:hypothetical protein